MSCQSQGRRGQRERENEQAKQIEGSEGWLARGCRLEYERDSRVREWSEKKSNREARSGKEKRDRAQGSDAAAEARRVEGSF